MTHGRVASLVVAASVSPVFAQATEPVTTIAVLPAGEVEDYQLATVPVELMGFEVE